MITIINADVIHGLQSLPDQSVQTVVTSPPYWALRDYGNDGQIGLEKTPQEYIDKIVNVFREIRRVLRNDGTAWVNMGDGYGQQRGSGFNSNSKLPDENKDLEFKLIPGTGLKPKDLIGMPWRLALALQADGWWLRSDIIWHKPNPMPESANDRPTKSHEYIFLLTKSSKYYYDNHAIREKTGNELSWDEYNVVKDEWQNPRTNDDGILISHSGEGKKDGGRSHPDGRNKRTVWTIPTSPYPGAHYATFPPALPEICIKAGTSEKGSCPQCGTPWERIVERKYKNQKIGASEKYDPKEPQFGTNVTYGRGEVDTQTLGWKPAPNCNHGGTDNLPHDPIPCTVLDPFNGHGTTGLVAARLGRSYIGIEINHEDCIATQKRIQDDNPLFNNVQIVHASERSERSGVGTPPKAAIGSRGSAP